MRSPAQALLHALAMICLGSGTMAADDEVTIGRYSYFTNTTTSPYIDYRSTSATGVVTAIDLKLGTLVLRSIYTDRVNRSPDGKTVLLKLADDCQLIVDNIQADLRIIKEGDTVHAWLEGVETEPATDRPPAEGYSTGTVQSLHLLRGVGLSEQWFPEILLRPDERGRVFFDDFESGDLRKWHYQTGCAGILERGALHGKYAFTATRPKQAGRAMDYLYLYGLPQMDDVWMRWSFLFTGQPADTANFSIFRIFPEAGAQVFAVRIVAPMMSNDGKWYLACQLAQANAIAGSIGLNPGMVHTIKIHWKHASRSNASDGTIETWIDGRKDLDLVEIAPTWAETPRTGRVRKMARLAMGVMHTGDRVFGGTIVIDDLWIGDRDPEASLTMHSVIEAAARERALGNRQLRQERSQR